MPTILTPKLIRAAIVGLPDELHDKVITELALAAGADFFKSLNTLREVKIRITERRRPTPARPGRRPHGGEPVFTRAWMQPTSLNIALTMRTTACRIASVIIAWAGRRGFIRTLTKSIATTLDCSVRTVQRGLRELEEGKFIGVSYNRRMGIVDLTVLDAARPPLP